MLIQNYKIPFRLLSVSIFGVLTLIILFAASGKILALFGGNQKQAEAFFKSITVFIIGMSFSFAIPYLVLSFIKRSQKVLQAGGASGALITIFSNDKSISYIMRASYITLIINFLLFTWFAYSEWIGGV
jgi:magnesium-transporting ATPase (P-type)